MSDHEGFTEVDVPSQSGKCFIVTGANAGVGFELSRVLAARGARVLLGYIQHCAFEGKDRLGRSQCRAQLLQGGSLWRQ